MLTQVLTSQYQQFVALAEAWLADGATAFTVWSDDRVVAHWPAGQPMLPPSLSSPITVGNRMIGNLCISGLSTPTAQMRLAAEAGLTAQLARLEESLHLIAATLSDSHGQLGAAYNMQRAAQGLLAIEQLLQQLAVEAMRQSGAEGSFVIVVPPTAVPTLITCPEPHLDEASIWSIFWRTQATERQDWWIVNGDELPEHVHSMLLVPLQLGSTAILLGLLNNPQGSFTTQEAITARLVAQQSSVGLSYALMVNERQAHGRLQSEIAHARRVQNQLLPQSAPRVAGLDIGARSRSALSVGGDFYDFVALPSRPFIFSVGDVVGKGLPAALLMTMTRAAIHSKASFLPRPTPASVMRQSHEDLYDDFAQVGSFATALVGQYAPEQREIIYANAGHAPVIYRPFDGPARLLESDSTPVGVLPVSSCQNHSIAMRPGDLLIVATDGFSEAHSAQDELFGNERLLWLADNYAAQPAQTIADALFREVDRFSGRRPQDDDQTLVVIKGVSE